MGRLAYLFLCRLLSRPLVIFCLTYITKKMNKNKFQNKLSAGGPAYLPLYKQVEEYVKQLIVEQRWKAGEM